MSLNLLFISLLFFTVLCLFAIIELTNKKAFLFAVIPLAIFLVGSTIYTYTEIMGYSTTKELPNNFLIVSFIIDEPKSIYLWTIKNRKDAPRAYEIPYKKSTHKKLVEAKKRLAKKGRFGTILQGKKSQDTEKTLEFFLYNFIEQEFMRKDNEG